MRYHQQLDREWIRPRKRGFRMRCCRCSLVHIMDFRIVGTQVRFRAGRVRGKR